LTFHLGGTDYVGGLPYPPGTGLRRRYFHAITAA